MLRLADYPDPEVDFDDIFYFSYTIAKKIDILVISDIVTDTSNGIGAILGSVPSFNLNFNKSNAINYSSFSDNNLVIVHGVPSISSGLNAELGKFAGNGGNVMIIPSEKT
jgi:hypothetical protein